MEPMSQQTAVLESPLPVAMTDRDCTEKEKTVRMESSIIPFPIPQHTTHKHYILSILRPY